MSIRGIPPLLLTFSVLALCSSAAYSQAVESKPPALTLADAQTLFTIARGATVEIPEKLKEKSNLPLILTLYNKGVAIQRVGREESLAESAAAAGTALRGFIEKVPALNDVYRRQPLEIEVVIDRTPIETTDPIKIMGELQLGINGIVCLTGEKTVFLTPLAILKHSLAMNPVAATYTAISSSQMPDTARLEKMSTLGFVEAVPMGTALALERGNVLLKSTSVGEVLTGSFMAGAWLLRHQREDGEFPGEWTPIGTKLIATLDDADQLRAVSALLQLHSVTKDEHFNKAAQNALTRILDPAKLTPTTGKELIHVPSDTDEITPTALLLSALCQRALSQGETADRRMILLSDFLLAMQTADGRLCPKLELIEKPNPPCIVRGAPYAEALIALSLLQHISPSADRGKFMDRLADLLIEPPPELSFRSDQRTIARIIEALLAYYRQKPSEKHAAAAIKLADELAARQFTPENAPWPDYVGGFAEANLPPDTITTAAAVCGLQAGYELRLLMRQPTEQLALPIRQGALFLLNMQYRPENTFFLINPEEAVGILRKSPLDLNVQLSAAADSIRALAGAYVVTLETQAPK